MKPEESPPQAETHTLETMELRATGQVCWVAGACLPITCEQVDHPYGELRNRGWVSKPQSGLERKHAGKDGQLLQYAGRTQVVDGPVWGFPMPGFCLPIRCHDVRRAVVTEWPGTVV